MGFFKQVTGLIEASLTTSAFSLFCLFGWFFYYISVFQFIWKCFAQSNYQMHNFEQKMVASFAMNLEFSYCVLIKAFKTILAFYL